MAFKANLSITGELCDKCKKPMTEANPGIEMYATTRESGRNYIWVHVKELRKVFQEMDTQLGNLISSETPDLKNSPSCPHGLNDSNQCGECVLDRR